MTPLRKRMMEDMQLHGFSKGSQKVYISAIRRLAERYGKSPEQHGNLLGLVRHPEFLGKRDG